MDAFEKAQAEAYRITCADGCEYCDRHPCDTHDGRMAGSCDDYRNSFRYIHAVVDTEFQTAHFKAEYESAKARSEKARLNLSDFLNNRAWRISCIGLYL